MLTPDKGPSSSGQGRSARRGRVQRRSPRRLEMEFLESRLVPTTSTWSGAVGSTWSTAGNWDNPPASGYDVVFPAGASNLTNTNDLGADMGFNSLTISGSGYDIGGESVTLGSIDASQTSGSSTVDLPIAWSGTGSVSVENAGAELVLSGAITGSAGLTTQGAGVLDLTAANTYTGTTEVAAGTLLVDGSQAGSPVTIASGATLGGVGTVGSITASGGTVSPGDTGPGLLTDSGELTLQADASSNNSVFAVQLDGATASTGYSQLQVSGNIDLDDATLDLTLGSDFVPSAGASFTIINNTGTSAVSGTFSGLAPRAYLTVSGTSFQISYQGGAGNDVVLTEVTPSTTAVTVSPVSPVSGQSVALTATVTVPGGDPAPTGSVEFYSGATALGSEALSDGVATLDTTTLPVGDNSITADYSGDTNFASSTSAAVPVTVAATATSTTTVTISPGASVYGESVTLTATVAPISPDTGTATGSVEFFNGTTLLGTETLSGGVATLDTSSLPIADNSITADYSGDSNFTASTSAAMSVPVTQAASTTILSFSPTSLVTGESVTLTATVSAVSPATGTPTGTVEFFNGTTSLGTGTLSNGVATLATTALPAGINSVTAQYEGDSNFQTSTTGVLSVPVNQASTTTTLTAFPVSPISGQSVTLTATVAAVSPGVGTPTGTVEFLNGTTDLGTATLSDGTATFTTTTLPVATSSITVDYSGDSNFSSSTASAVTVTVASTATSTTVVTFSPSTAVYGESVTLTATVAPISPATGTATGSAEFFSGTTLLGTGTLVSGVATLTSTTIPAGDDSITADYSGDSNFTASTSTAVTVPITQSASTTTLAFSPSTSVYGQSVTLTATVAAVSPGAGTATGTVEFFNGSTDLGTGTLSNGVATLDTTALPVGSDSVTADYSGDNNFTSSTSTAVTVPVTQASSTTTVTFFPVAPVSGQSVTLTATVAAVSPGGGTPTGTVEFLNDGTSIGTGTLIDGVATFVTSTLAIGDNTITADYSGDTNFTASTASAVTLPVASAATSTLTFSPSTSVYGQSVTLTATVAPISPATGTPTGTAEFFDGTTLLGTGTLSDGVATLDTTALPVGSDSITAIYSGDSNFTASTSTAVTVPVTQAASTTTVTFSPSAPVYGESTTLTATITAVSPGSGTPTGKVEFLDGTTDLGTATLSDGVATLDTTALLTGANTITADYSGDSNFTSSTSTATVTIAQAASTTTIMFVPTSPVLGQSVTLTASVSAVSPGAGTPTGTVEFLLNGTTDLGTATLSDGVATLTTTALAAGDNTITADYSGDSNLTTSTAGTVTVTVVQTTSTTTVSVSNSNPSAYETVTLTAVVAPSATGIEPTGSVEFLANGTIVGTAALSGGQATLSLSSLSIGSDSITAQYLGDSNFTGSTSAAVTVVVGTADQQWLNAVYLVQLDRAPTASDLAYWDNQLAKGRSNKEVAFAISNSPEARYVRVVNAFEDYLGETPTARQIYNVVITAESTHTSVMAVILGSPQFIDASGGSLSDYTAYLATAVLGTTSYQTYLTTELSRGVAPMDVAENLLLSNAGQAALLTDSFETLFDSVPTSQQLASGVKLMDRGIYLWQITAYLLATDNSYFVATTGT
jgi:trimeric autotransporter adhesin